MERERERSECTGGGAGELFLQKYLDGVFLTLFFLFFWGGDFFYQVKKEEEQERILHINSQHERIGGALASSTAAASVTAADGTTESGSPASSLSGPAPLPKVLNGQWEPWLTRRSNKTF